jgi:hypothetical protein
LRFLADDQYRVAGVVAADVEKMLDLVRLQHLENFLAIGRSGLSRVEPSAEDGVLATSSRL